MAENENNMLDKSFSAVCWLKIFLSPFLIGLLLGVIGWLFLRGAAGIAVGALFAVIGAVAGCKMAENARKKTGTVAFCAKTMNNPEFNKPESK